MCAVAEQEIAAGRQEVVECKQLMIIGVPFVNRNRVQNYMHVCVFAFAQVHLLVTMMRFDFRAIKQVHFKVRRN